MFFCCTITICVGILFAILNSAILNNYPPADPTLVLALPTISLYLHSEGVIDQLVGQSETNIGTDRSHGSGRPMFYFYHSWSKSSSWKTHVSLKKLFEIRASVQDVVLFLQWVPRDDDYGAHTRATSEGNCDFTYAPIKDTILPLAKCLYNFLWSISIIIFRNASCYFFGSTSRKHDQDCKLSRKTQRVREEILSWEWLWWSWQIAVDR